MAGELRFPSIIVEVDLQGVVNMFNVNREMDQSVAIILDDMIQPWILLMDCRIYFVRKAGISPIWWLDLGFTGKKLYEAMLQESLLWVGPALLFSTATAISVLGWDGKVRTILSISMPNAGYQLLVHVIFCVRNFLERCKI
ncbi:hypothetical protein HYC85_000116 [Camellia sinensis]|uniref:Uncharacterized protein n=1 Tax=Camellia sinensis TaxID=4442 RepID=A0A7J7FQK0_CAMSI|nr:hypothetical protein HYC85_000116 [Camellia sinensis]